MFNVEEIQEQIVNHINIIDKALKDGRMHLYTPDSIALLQAKSNALIALSNTIKK